MTGKSGNNAAGYLISCIPNRTDPKTFFSSYRISTSEELVIRTAAKDDARKYVYNAIVSFIGGLICLHSQQAAWAVTKMYYTAFYIGRAALCRSNLVIFHVPKPNSNGNTQYQIRVSAGQQAEIVNKYPSTHKLVARRFLEAGYPIFMRSLLVDGVDPILWLMEQREYWQYRAGRFSDPDLPDVLYKVDSKKMPRLLLEYEADSTGIFLADRSHAIVSIPFRLILWALSQDSLLSAGVIDEEDIKYLRIQCRLAGNHLGALEKHLPRP
jgi:hypothetical protein